PPDASADDLDGRHERQGEKHRPGEVVPELGAGLRVGGDAAWVIVGSACDQSRTKSVPCAAKNSGTAALCIRHAFPGRPVLGLACTGIRYTGFAATRHILSVDLNGLAE